VESHWHQQYQDKRKCQRRRCRLNGPQNAKTQQLNEREQIHLPQSNLIKQVLPKVIWEECITIPNARKCMHPLRVLLAAQCLLQTSPITQPLHPQRSAACVLYVTLCCTTTLLLLLEPFNSLLDFVRDYLDKGKTNLDLLEQEIVSGSGISQAICKYPTYISSLTGNHASIPPLSFLQAGCPS